MPPPGTYLRYLCKYTYEGIEKLDFSQLYVWKRTVSFYPVKLFRFAKKNKVCLKYQNFIRGDPYKLGRTIYF